MKITPKNFLCKKCLKKMNQYDSNRKKVWRIKVRSVGKDEKGKVKVRNLS